MDKTLPPNPNHISTCRQDISFMTLRGIVGSVFVAAGGMLLFVALYLVLYTALYQHSNPTQGLAGAMFLGFVGFLLVADGLSFVINSAVSS